MRLSIQFAFDTNKTFGLDDDAFRRPDLRLMSSVNDVSNMPTEGKNLVIVASVQNMLGFDIRLMSSLNDVSGIPTEGKNLIIVAAVNNVLHFRIFDGDGKVMVDTDEKRLTEQARQIKDLRKQLKSLWPPHEMTSSDKGRVVTAVTSIVGHTHMLHFRIFDTNGKRVVNTDEDKLPDKAQQIAQLKLLLNDLWDIRPRAGVRSACARLTRLVKCLLHRTDTDVQLSQGDKDRVITAVTSIVDHTHPEDREYIDTGYTNPLGNGVICTTRKYGEILSLWKEVAYKLVDNH